MFELSVSVNTAVPPDHMTASNSDAGPQHRGQPEPSEEHPQGRSSTNAALIAAAVNNGPADMPNTRNGTAIR